MEQIKSHNSYKYPQIKMSLKIPKGEPEFVNRRRTDNTMAKRKRTDSDVLQKGKFRRVTDKQHEDRVTWKSY